MIQLKLYIYILLISITVTTYSQGIQVKFQVPQLSVNVAEGTTELLPNFIVFTDTLNVEENSIEL